MKQIYSKSLLLSVVFIFTSLTAYSQTPYTSAVEYQKTKQAAVVIDYNHSSDNVENALKAIMKKRGYSAKSNKGFITYSGIPNIKSGSQVTLMFKIDAKSKKEKGQAIMYLLTEEQTVDQQEGGNFTNALKSFLEALYPDIEAYRLEEEITDQQKLIKKEQNNYDKLVKDGVDLEKQREKIEKQIKQNIEDVVKQKAEVEIQQNNLNTLLSKRTRN
jgi:hypothetical protein